VPITDQQLEANADNLTSS